MIIIMREKKKKEPSCMKLVSFFLFHSIGITTYLVFEKKK